MLKYHPADMKKILASKFHWSNKCNLVANMVEQYSGSTEVAKLLGKSKHFVTDCVLLSKYCKEFPNLNNVSGKGIALMLIKDFKNNNWSTERMKLKIEETLLYEQHQRERNLLGFPESTNEQKLSEENSDDEEATGSD